MYKPASGVDIILMREYARGVLRKEAVLRVGQIDLRRKEVKTDKVLRSEEKRAAAKVRHEKVSALLDVQHEESYMKTSTGLIERKVHVMRCS